jgi:8-oxo-dGTP diphosphatase
MHTGSIPNAMLINSTSQFVPHLSLDCVVFGFHENQLKILLLQLPHQKEKALPGGYVMIDETLEEAAIRILKERTGIGDLFLQQFHTFSRIDRVKTNFPRKSLKKLGFPDSTLKWLSNRFITVGFYALVEYSKVVPSPDELSESCDWYDLGDAGTLMMDHNEILNKALDCLRLQLNHQPVGLNLLPEKFTMPELQKMYETILGKKLDRRNFQRKVKSYNILEDLHERKAGVAHKAPFLYRFNVQNYTLALNEGLKGRW